jgi:hypothetical protein
MTKGTVLASCCPHHGESSQIALTRGRQSQAEGGVQAMGHRSRVESGDQGLGRQNHAALLEPDGEVPGRWARG